MGWMLSGMMWQWSDDDVAWSVATTGVLWGCITAQFGAGLELNCTPAKLNLSSLFNLAAVIRCAHKDHRAAHTNHLPISVLSPVLLHQQTHPFVR